MQTVTSPTSNATNSAQTAKDNVTKSMSSSMNAASETIHEKSSQIAREFRTFLHDMESLLKSSSDMSSEDFTKAKAKLNERIATAKKSLETLGGNVSERATKTATTANNYVHEQPWPIIGASAALGFVAGYLLTNRE